MELCVGELHAADGIALVVEHIWSFPGDHLEGAPRRKRAEIMRFVKKQLKGANERKKETRIKTGRNVIVPCFHQFRGAQGAPKQRFA